MRLGAALTAILECAETELVAVDRDVPELSSLQPGLPAFDEPCGQLWTRVVQGWPSASFPQRFSDIRPCGVPLAMKIGLGIIRCQTGIEQMSQPGGHPTAAELTDDTNGLICDQGALYRAIACCYPALDGAEDIIVDEWTPLDPQGGVIGGEWLAWIGTDLTCGETGGSP